MLSHILRRRSITVPILYHVQDRQLFHLESHSTFCIPLSLDFGYRLRADNSILSPLIPLVVVVSSISSVIFAIISSVHRQSPSRRVVCPRQNTRSLGVSQFVRRWAPFCLLHCLYHASPRMDGSHQRGIFPGDMCDHRTWAMELYWQVNSAGGALCGYLLLTLVESLRGR